MRMYYSSRLMDTSTKNHLTMWLCCNDTIACHGLGSKRFPRRVSWRLSALPLWWVSPWLVCSRELLVSSSKSVDHCQGDEIGTSRVVLSSITIRVATRMDMKEWNRHVSCFNGVSTKVIRSNSTELRKPSFGTKAVGASHSAGQICWITWRLRSQKPNSCSFLNQQNSQNAWCPSVFIEHWTSSEVLSRFANLSAMGPAEKSLVCFSIVERPTAWALNNPT